MLLAATILMLLAASATLAAARHFVYQSERRTEARTVAALAEAREALLGYAASYPELHPGQGPGYLPCPDAANTGSAPGVACHARGLAAFGRFPYRTLGLPVPVDGQCLWYAVSGNFKHNPKALRLNWDSPGQFTVVDTGGRAPGGENLDAVAALIAPGPPLPGQERPPATTTGPQRCPGGNAIADLPAFLDRAYGSGSAGDIAIIHGLPGSDANDIVSWLTADDIFDILRLRPDFSATIDAALEAAATALQARLGDPDFIGAHAETLIGNRAHGRMPDAVSVAPEAADIYEHWHDQLRFAACADGNACLKASLTDSAASPAEAIVETCRAIVIFGGQRRRGEAAQRRRSEDERTDPAQYLEGENLVSYTTGTGDYSGFRHYAVTDRRRPASEDLLRCIP
jgi:hypothetical protein